MKFTFRARLYAGFAVVICVFLCVIGITVIKVQRALDDVRSLKAETQQMNMAAEWLANIRQNSARSLAVARSPGKDMFLFFKEPMAAVTADTTKTQKAFLDAVTRPEIKGLADKLGAVRSNWVSVRDEVNKLKDAGDDAGSAQLVDSRLVPITDTYIAAAQGLVNGQLGEVGRLKDEVEAAFASLYKWLLAMTLLAIVIAVVVSWRFGSALVGALTAARASAEKIGHGDLAATIHSHGHDEVGQLMQSLEQARASLEKVILQARQASDNIQVAATEVATGNQDLANRTEAAASNLEQTASSMEEITATVRQSADAAAQANQLAATATEVAQRGGAVVSQVVSTMDDINQSSRQIADIIGVIDSIAFQTNILALNAAVEAARAGEQGRGFAVVASEVRNLAGRSAQAAKEIKDLISASVDKVQTGSQLVQSAGSTMDDIVASVQRVTDVMAEITAAAAEQSNGIAQVNVAVSQLDQMTQQNAALVEQSSAAAESLRDQAHQLADVVSVFRVSGAAGLSRPSAAPAPRLVQASAHTVKKVAAKPMEASVGGRKSLKNVGPSAHASASPTSSAAPSQAASTGARPALKRPAPIGSPAPAPQQAPAAASKAVKASADNGDWESF